MSSQPTEYEQLPLEVAARIDAACDRFEQAWKAVPAGGTIPNLAAYVGEADEPTFPMLLRELAAIDRACRQRYGFPAQPDENPELGAVARDSVTSVAGSGRRGVSLPASRMANGPRVSGLELLEVLGSGGMGVIFKARQLTLGREVAVKFVQDAHLEGARQHERFLREARAIARLKHPHLVQLYEFGEVPSTDGATSQPYLVLEYIPGGSLADHLRGSSLSPGEAARLIETLAEAIHYAHQQGVIHRDLKPANILLQKSEIRNPQSDAQTEIFSDVRFKMSELYPKITDFGLAKFLTEAGLTRTGDVLGTPSYMAPEQAIGKVGVITAAVDVYGLGAILYEALTGRPPFRAETGVATLSQVQQDDPVPPRRLQPTVPRDLETICLKCLRKEAGRRYATAQELADDLRHFRAGESIRARPVGRGERVVRWCRRKPVVAGLLAALVFVFLAGFSGVLVLWQRDRRHAAEAERERDIARQQQKRAEHHLRRIRESADRLTKLGNDLWQRPGLSDTGKAVLDEALIFYQQLLPEEGSDPDVRLEAAQLYHSLGGIHHILGQWDQAVEAFGQEAHLLFGLLAVEPPKPELRLQLANSHRSRAHVLRDLGKLRDARAAYGQAAELHEQLLGESPADPHAKIELANTLQNLTTVLSALDDAETLKPLYDRILELDRAAVADAPEDVGCKAELALGLEAQGVFFLDTRQNSRAEHVLREALTIRQQLLASGRVSRAYERYVARSHANMGRAQAAAGQPGSAEKSYREGMKLLDQSVKEFPHLLFYRIELAETMASLADLLEGRNRRQEAEKVRRRVVGQYETLITDFPVNSENLRGLVQSYVLLGSVLWDLSRHAEAAEMYRKALKRDPESPGANNGLAQFLATGPELPLRNPAEAARLAQKAITASPQTGIYWNTLGAARYRCGEHKVAIAALESSMRLRQGGDSYDWFFLAMANQRLGAGAEASRWFARAVAWMDQHQLHNPELRRLRAEAEGVLANGGKPRP
jgi:tetratricopeptide (TPR) repeat protein